jgi:hypothetical protein
VDSAGVAAPLCAATGKEAKMPRHALKFCHIFPDKSCCLPAQDAEIEEHYFTLLDAGDICAKESSMAKDALKMIFCAACSPEQPRYVNRADGAFKICSNIAKKVKPAEFDECGMVRVEERGDLCAGDDVVVPSEQWPTTTESFEQGWYDDGNAHTCCNNPDLGACEVTMDVNSYHSDGNPAYSYHSCMGYWKFINDPSGAFPPFLDGGAVSYIQIVECEENALPEGVTSCNELCYTGAASPNAVTHAAILAISLIAVLSTVLA